MCIYIHIHLYIVSLFLNSGANFVKFIQNKVILEVLRNLQSERKPVSSAFISWEALVL